MRLPFTRFFGPSLTMVGLLVLSYFGLTNGIDLGSLGGIDPGAAAIAESLNVASGSKPDDRIRIAAYNIQHFSDNKSNDREVMKVLTQICLQFDLVAIQEVRSPKADPVGRLVQWLNRAGGKYAYVVSDPIGRVPSHMEQYAFVWDTRRVRLIPESVYVVDDSADRLHREPLVASFEMIPPPEVLASAGADAQPFTVTLINAHTDPDLVKASLPAHTHEMDVLRDVYLRVRQWEFAQRGEDDVILLGDLNVPTRGLRGMGEIPGILSVAGHLPTNTRGTATYDHILIDENHTTEFLRVAGVIDYERDLGLSEEQASAVSDHRPVWAEFRMLASPARPGGPVAALAGEAQR